MRTSSTAPDLSSHPRDYAPFPNSLVEVSLFVVNLNWTNITYFESDNVYSNSIVLGFWGVWQKKGGEAKWGTADARSRVARSPISKFVFAHRHRAQCQTCYERERLCYLGMSTYAGRNHSKHQIKSIINQIGIENPTTLIRTLRPFPYPKTVVIHMTLEPYSEIMSVTTEMVAPW